MGQWNGAKSYRAAVCEGLYADSGHWTLVPILQWPAEQSWTKELYSSWVLVSHQ